MRLARRALIKYKDDLYDFDVISNRLRYLIRQHHICIRKNFLETYDLSEQFHYAESCKTINYGFDFIKYRR